MSKLINGSKSPKESKGGIDWYSERADRNLPEQNNSKRAYEGESISNQPISFPIDRDGHDFHALFQYMFYTWVQNCTLIESFFNKILNKIRHAFHLKLSPCRNSVLVLKR